AAVADPDAVAARAPAAAFPTVGAAQLLDQADGTTTVERAIIAAVVDGFADHLPVAQGAGVVAGTVAGAIAAAMANLALEHGAAAVGHPDEITPGTPVKPFAAFAAAQLLDQTHLATTIQRAFLPPVVDGLAGDLSGTRPGSRHEQQGEQQGLQLHDDSSSSAARRPDVCGSQPLSSAK